MTFKPGQTGNPNGSNAHTRLTRAHQKDMAEALAAKGITPLEFMMGILWDETKSMTMRMWAAEKAAPYVHPRLAQIEHSGEQRVVYHISDKRMSVDEWAAKWADMGTARRPPDSVN